MQFFLEEIDGALEHRRSVGSLGIRVVSTVEKGGCAEKHDGDVTSIEALSLVSASISQLFELVSAYSMA